MTIREPADERYEQFPRGFFDRADERDDREFYDVPRIVTHIDNAAIAAVGDFYDSLGLQDRSPVLDIMSSWVSHFSLAPAALTVLGMNASELGRNRQATERVVHDLNADPVLPFADDCFGAACCAVSVDYLTRPLEVFDEIARVVEPGGVFVCTFSNRCFPTKVISGWLRVGEAQRPQIVASYFRLSTGWTPPKVVQLSAARGADPLWAVWASAV